MSKSGSHKTTIAVFAATRPLGRLIVSYLATHCYEDECLVMVDADRQALLGMREDLGEWGRKIVIDEVDGAEGSACDQLAARAQRIIDVSLNERLLQACVDQGADYIACADAHAVRPQPGDLKALQSRLVCLRSSRGVNLDPADLDIAVAKTLAECALYLSRAGRKIVPPGLTTVLQAGGELCTRLEAVAVPDDFLATLQ